MFEVLQEGEVVLREGIRGEALQKIKILVVVSLCTIVRVHAEGEEVSEVRYAVVVFCQSRKAAAGLELKMFHHEREGGRNGGAYLLLGPR
jgi:hypothetical protein